MATKKKGAGAPAKSTPEPEEKAEPQAAKAERDSGPPHAAPTAPEPPGAEPPPAVDLPALGAAADASLRQALLAGVREAELVSRGARIATDRLLAAVPAFLAEVRSIWSGLDAERRALVIGYDPALDAILAAEAVKLGTLRQMLENTSSATVAERAQSRVALAEVARGALALREQVLTVLHALVPLADDESGPVETAAALAASLDRLAGLVERHTVGSPPGTVAMLRRLRVTPALGDELRQASATVAAAGEKAEAVAPEARVTRHQLDIQDGVVLHLVGLIYLAFVAASRRDAGISAPSLGALVRLFPGRERSPSGV